MCVCAWSATWSSFVDCGLTQHSLVLSVFFGVQKSSRTKGSKDYHHYYHPQLEVSWSEQYKSIRRENRFRLAFKVMLIRLIDALVCCVWLPRTAYLCRATGHCPSAMTYWELTGILHPVGITSALREDYYHHHKRHSDNVNDINNYQYNDSHNVFESIRPDRGSALAVVLSVVLVSVLLLVAQLLTLDRSYLAMMGYLAGEWKLVDKDELSSMNAYGAAAPAPWDPRRRYKKGDLILYNTSSGGFSVGGGSSSSSSRKSRVYMAVSSHPPEGPPFDLFLRASHDLFRHELGHQSTSRILAVAFRIHAVFIALLVGLLALYLLRNDNTAALRTALVANVIALHGLVRVGTTNRAELNTVAKEIAGKQS